MKKIIEIGLKAANTEMFKEDKVWARYSNDKVDIGETLAKVIRTLVKELALSKDMRAFSIGSSNEPQFRILETVFRGGLYLLDIEKSALDIVKERIRRQYTGHVKTILGDYRKFFLNPEAAKVFLKTKLANRKTNLISLYHSLYYSEKSEWSSMFNNLFRFILAQKGAIHAVLMVSESNDPSSTTWLYNHFTEKFFGHNNNQDLLKLKNELCKNPLFCKAQIISKTSRVRYFVDDFGKFMAVVWMILLYPSVHRYNLKQREEITEFVYKKFWRKKRPLLQQQDHLVVYRGIGFKGLI